MPNRSVETVTRAELAEQKRRLASLLRRASVRHDHIIGDFGLLALAVDVHEQVGAVLELTRGSYPRTAFANARSALEAVVDMAYLVSDVTEFDRLAARLRVAEALHTEILREKWNRADSELAEGKMTLAMADVADVIEAEAKHLDARSPGQGDHLREAHREMTTSRFSAAKHWSGLQRTQLFAQVEKRDASLFSGFDAMLTMMYGHASYESHPTPRGSDRKGYIERPGAMLTANRQENRQPPVGMAYAAAMIACMCLEKREIVERTTQ